MTSRSSAAPGRVSVLAYATKRGTGEQARAAFDWINQDNDTALSQAKIQDYLERHGYGQDEIDRFVRRTAHIDGLIYFDDFERGWCFLGKYTISQHCDEDAVILRKPGSLKERDFVIEDCKGVTIAVCDNTSQVQVDCCDLCRILVGPCQGSVFLRDCSNCTFSIATRQLRVRDCKACTIYLYCNTEPVIETSKSLSFAPFNAAYGLLSTQFEIANLPPSENLWHAIYNFNGGDSDADTHWRELPAEDWNEWELCEVSDHAPENPVPRTARAEIPADSPWRGNKMGPGSKQPAGVKSRVCGLL